MDVRTPPSILLLVHLDECVERRMRRNRQDGLHGAIRHDPFGQQAIDQSQQRTTLLETTFAIITDTHIEAAARAPNEAQ